MTSCRGLVLAGALLSPASAIVWGHPKEGKEYPTYPGYSLYLVEEFDSPLDLDRDRIWTWGDGGLPEGGVRFVRDAISFEDGKMKLTARENDTWRYEPCSHANAGTWPQIFPLHSGEVRTKHNMFRYGRYEVSMKAPEVQPGNPDIDGNFIATMFAYKDAADKFWREIDIEVTSNAFDAVTSNVLYADNQIGWYKEMSAVKENRVNVNVKKDFHTFAFEWLPDNITWYFDGKLIRVYNSTTHLLPDSGYTLSDMPEKATKIMMSLWIYSDKWDFGGPNGENNRYPMTVEYDWFRFYKWDGDKDYPCSNPGNPDCLIEEDKWRASNNPCDGITQEFINCTAKCTRHEEGAHDWDAFWAAATVALAIPLVFTIGCLVYIVFIRQTPTAEDDKEISLATES